MLTVIIPKVEKYDEKENEFIYTKSYTIQLEHSLVAISKWESKWNKPFLSKKDKSAEELLDYVRCMTITQNIPNEAYDNIPRKTIEQIIEYIGASMTATTFYTDEQKKGKNDVITSEVIYYWMIALNIPFECQKWHLNRLLTLIRVCNIKNQPKKKVNKKKLMSRNAQINAARRKQLNSRG